MITRRQFIKTFIGVAVGYCYFGFNVITAHSSTTEAKNSSIFNLAVISDIHVRHNNLSFQNRFRKALDDLTINLEPRLDVIVINGDLGDGLPADYETLKRIIEESLINKDIPLFFTIGNHEFYKSYHNHITDLWSPHTFPNGETDAMAIERFLKFTRYKNVYWDTYVKGYHLIFLGSEKSSISNREIGDKAYLSYDQLNWLREKLNENYIPGKPILVFLHQPILNTAGYEDRFVVQGEELINILRQYPEVITFSGHTHLELGSKASVIKDIFTQYNESAIAYVRDMHFRIVPDKSEGICVKVFPNKVNVEGKEFLS